MSDMKETRLHENESISMAVWLSEQENNIEDISLNVEEKSKGDI